MLYFFELTKLCDLEKIPTPLLPEARIFCKKGLKFDSWLYQRTLQGLIERKNYESLNLRMEKIHYSAETNSPTKFGKHSTTNYARRSLNYYKPVIDIFIVLIR